MELKIWGCIIEVSGDSCGNENETLPPPPNSQDILMSFEAGFCFMPFIFIGILIKIKLNRCTNFQIYFWNKTLHISDSSSVHRQEFFNVHTAMVYVVQVCCVYSARLLMMDRGTVRNM